MDNQSMFLDCPAYLDEYGAVRCALPTGVERRYFARSTSGPVENVMIRCPVGHLFNAPIEFLSLPKHPGTGDEGAPEREAQSPFTTSTC